MNIIGYKVAFSSEASQQMFDVRAPAYGVLSADMIYQEAILHLANFTQLRLENEIAFRIGQDIQCELNRDSAPQYVDGVAPAIEAPDFIFANQESVSGQDIIEANCIAAACILGSWLNPQQIDVDAVTVCTTCNEQFFDSGTAAAVYGSPWESLCWLSNTLLHKGTPLRRGQIILTGAMGKMLPAQPGRYHADYGALGTIAFVVK